MSLEHHYPYPLYYSPPGQPMAPAGAMAPGGYPAGAYPMAAGYAAYAPQPPHALPAAAYPPASSPFFNFSNDRFLKGLLIGAAAAYVLTNEDVQRTAIKGVVKVWSFLQGGLEEIKERFHDAEAELHAAELVEEEAATSKGA